MAEGVGRAVAISVGGLGADAIAAAAGAAACIDGLTAHPISVVAIRHITNAVSPTWYAAQRRLGKRFWGAGLCSLGDAWGGGADTRLHAHCNAVRVRGFCG